VATEAAASPAPALRTAANGANGTNGANGASGGGAGGGGAGAAGPAARAATAAHRARIVHAAVNRKQTGAKIRIACPKAAPTTCFTSTSATYGAKVRAAAGKRANVRRGRSQVVSLKLVRKAHTSLAKRRGKLTFTVATQFGTKRFTVSKGFTVKKLRKARH